MVVVLENAIIAAEDGGTFYFNAQCPDCDRIVPGNHYFSVPFSRTLKQAQTTCHCGVTYRSVFCLAEDVEMYQRYGY